MSNREIIPEAQHMLELARSDRSEPFHDRELIEAVLHKDSNHLNESVGSRISTMVPHRSQNGSVSRPASVVSKRSTNLSQERLSSIVSGTFKNTEHEKSTEKEKARLNIVSMAVKELVFMCVSTLVIAILSMQLLIALAERVTSSTSGSAGPGLTSTVSSSEYLIEVTTALLTFVIIWNITCFLVFAMQCIEIAAIMKAHTEEQRAVDFLNKCASIRFIARTGFFVSVPAFLIAVILFVVLWFSTAAALTALVIVCVAAIFCSYSLVLTCSWRRGWGKLLPDIGTQGTPGYTCPTAADGQQNGLAVSEMSTLV